MTAAAVNLGSILEALGDVAAATEVYATAAKRAPDDVSLLNAQCRALLRIVSGPAGPGRVAAFEAAKRACSHAVAMAPGDATANMHVGMLFKDGLDFAQAIVYLERALAAAPNDTIILTNLASTLARCAAGPRLVPPLTPSLGSEGDVPRAVDLTHRAISLGAWGVLA